MGMRRRARELALQLLYQHELTDASPEAMKRDFDDFKGASVATRNFATELLQGTLGKLQEIDTELDRQTANWRLDRLAAVARNILRLALFALLNEVDTPPAVVMNEAIEIAKRLGAAESPRFINGVLDGFVKRRRLRG